MLYDLQSLLDERNRTLYEGVASQLPVVLLDSGNDLWTAHLKNGTAEIHTADASWPGACFAHELLHISLRLRGLTCPGYVDNENIADIKEIVGWLFNILDHFKVYPEFLALGYTGDQFLADSDPSEVCERLDHNASELERRFIADLPIDPLALAMPIGMLLSPPPSQRWRYESRLKRVSPPGFFEDLEALLLEWQRSPTLNSSHTFAMFFKLCGYQRIGFSATNTQADIVVAGNL
jgi:hypothetical protein